MAQSSTSQYKKILQAHRVNTRQYWLVEVIENDCIVTRVGVYDEILLEPSRNPLGSGNISSHTPPLVTIQVQYILFRNRIMHNMKKWEMINKQKRWQGKVS